MPRVIVYVPKRFIAMIDKLAQENEESRSSVLAQVFTFGLLDYAHLYWLTTRLTGESRLKQDATHP
jgi:hypothetical protein